MVRIFKPRHQSMPIATAVQTRRGILAFVDAQSLNLKDRGP